MMWTIVAGGLLLLLSNAGSVLAGEELRVGAAAISIAGDDSMVIGGGIHAAYAKGQEGNLRTVAVVLQKGHQKLVLVACDVLFVPRDLIDPVSAEIEKTCGIPSSNILINATHTHHAPSTARVHGYQREELFCRNLQKAIGEAVRQANNQLKEGEAQMSFWLGEESTVGQNSRQLQRDGTIYWVGPQTEFLRPTGPFDPDLPVLAFTDPASRKLKAMIFNHSTHTIGSRKPGVRSPGFYGLAAQELEPELGGAVCFLEGASGSTHNLTLSTDEMILRIKNAVREAFARAEPRPVSHLSAFKQSFRFQIRTFDEAKEDKAVTDYCRKYAPAYADKIIDVFRQQRKLLAPQQGQVRTTWVQTLVIGDVAIVGVPAEFFTRLGLDIKRRSPYRYTCVAELANDWIGYLPDRKAFELGGYQTWTGLHSYAAAGTGEAMVDEAVVMLKRLHGQRPSE
jgi:hypothetical protein